MNIVTLVNTSKLTWKLEVLGLLQQELDLGEVLGEDWAAGSHEVEDVAEHSPISDRGRRVDFSHILRTLR